MRIRAVAALLVLLCAVSGAEAGVFGLFGSGHKHPKPIDDPTNLPNRPPFDHKQGRTTVYHAGGKYQDATWGREWHKIFKQKDIHVNHSLMK
jgi:hypothetical protein